MSWKTWTAAGLILVIGFAIYTFAAPESASSSTPVAPATQKTTAARDTTPGVEPVHIEWLDADSGSYDSSRNIFAFRKDPPPPPPP
ncbi:MAG TPA: hypothetical protein VN181_06890, partial [Thermoanaerobaculia bacterium]|nr:hypothetical protein [Thermoanaerobaculia bacterium]